MDKGGHTQPPIVVRQEGMCVKEPAMPGSHGRMDGVCKVMLGIRGNIEMMFEIEVGAVIVPIHKGRMGKERGASMEFANSIKDKGVGGGRSGDFVDQSSVYSTDEEVVWQKSDIDIIRGCVRVGKAGEGISGSHSSARGVDE